MIMPLLTSFEARAMESVQAATMPAVARLIRETVTPDEYGGQAMTRIVYAETTCDYAKRSLTGEKVQADQVQTLGEWAFSFPVGVVPLPDDSIEVDNRVFTITNIATYPYSTFTRVYANERT